MRANRSRVILSASVLLLLSACAGSEQNTTPEPVPSVEEPAPEPAVESKVPAGMTEIVFDSYFGGYEFSDGPITIGQEKLPLVFAEAVELDRPVLFISALRGYAVVDGERKRISVGELKQAGRPWAAVLTVGQRFLLTKKKRWLLTGEEESPTRTFLEALEDEARRKAGL